jgi:hypothetical protein
MGGSDPYILHSGADYTCAFAADSNTVGEALLKMPGKGAVAAFGPNTCERNEIGLMHEALMAKLGTPEARTLGELCVAAKEYAAARGAGVTSWNLLGDPAIALPLADVIVQEGDTLDAGPGDSLQATASVQASSSPLLSWALLSAQPLVRFIHPCRDTVAYEGPRQWDGVLLARQVQGGEVHIDCHVPDTMFGDPVSGTLKLLLRAGQGTDEHVGALHIRTHADGNTYGLASRNRDSAKLQAQYLAGVLRVHVSGQSTAGYRVRVFDCLGRVAAEHSVDRGAGSPEQLRCSLSAGVYVVVVENERLRLSCRVGIR